jgi:hypothetical protein
MGKWFINTQNKKQLSETDKKKNTHNKAVITIIFDGKL